MSAVKPVENDIRYFSFDNSKECAAFLEESSHYRLALVSSGSLSCRLTSSLIQYAEGDVFIIADGVPCSVSAMSEGLKVYGMAFSESVYADMTGFFECKPFLELIKNTGSATVRLKGIQRNKTEHDVAALKETDLGKNLELLRLSAANIIYDCFIKQNESMTWVKTPPDWFVEYYMLLSRHYIFTKSLPEIIALTGKSREYISRLFKSATGRNISDHIIDLRMNYACNLLKNSNIEVMEISFECGFENLSTFYHHFSKRIGMPPQTYRNSSRQQKNK